LSDEKIAFIREEVANALSRKKITRIRIDRETIKELCKIVGEKGKIYVDDEEARAAGFEKALVPPSIVLSILSPFISDFFISRLNRDIIREIKGFIHAGSKVYFFKPLYTSNEYVVEIMLSAISERKGKKGKRYIVTDVDVSLFENTGDIVFKDMHRVFLRVV